MGLRGFMPPGLPHLHQDAAQQAMVKQLAKARLSETLERLRSLAGRAREEWSREDRRFQAAEKAFLAWRLAVKAAALAALLETSKPETLLQEIQGLARGRGVVAVSERELDLYVTTSTAPRLARLLSTSSHVPDWLRAAAQRLRGAKDQAYKLHSFFYEGDPGAAGFEDTSELEDAFAVVLQAVEETMATIRAQLRRITDK